MMYSQMQQQQLPPPPPPPPHSPTSGGTRRRSNGRGGTTRRSKKPSSLSNKPLTKSSPSDVRKTSTGRLYMAPQATIRNTTPSLLPHHHHNHYDGGSVLVGEGMAGGGTSGNTRRRRRGSGTGAAAFPDNSTSTHRHMAADGPPIMAERQDSDDGSLGAMAAVLVQDREIRQLPHAPILWSDDPIDLDALTAPSPARMQRYHKKSDDSSPPPPEMNAFRYRTSPRAGKKRVHSGSNTQRGGVVKVDYGNEDYSENLDDSFRGGCDYSDQSLEKSSLNNNTNNNNKINKNSSSFWHPLWWYLRFNMMFKGKATSQPSPIFTFTHCLQISILLVLAIFVYDSHSKVQSHKDQLRQYDEERSHILEQMMWIDKAAKKVHKKYSEKEALDSILENDGSIGDNTGVDVVAVGDNKYEELAAQTKRDLMKMQHTIQLNARDILTSTFGESPAQVSLQITDDDKLVIGLSDDTPHAISTLVQQVNRHAWDEIEISASSDKLLVTLIPKLIKRRSSSSEVLAADGGKSVSAAPWLEFIERSHGCRTTGSVALRQVTPHNTNQVAREQEEDEPSDQTYLVLSVYLEDHDQPLPTGSVCIGQVLQGMDALVDLQHLANKYSPEY